MSTIGGASGEHDIDRLVRDLMQQNRSLILKDRERPSEELLRDAMSVGLTIHEIQGKNRWELHSAIDAVREKQNENTHVKAYARQLMTTLSCWGITATAFPEKAHDLRRLIAIVYQEQCRVRRERMPVGTPVRVNVLVNNLGSWNLHLLAQSNIEHGRAWIEATILRMSEREFTAVIANATNKRGGRKTMQFPWNSNCVQFPDNPDGTELKETERTAIITALRKEGISVHGDEQPSI